MTQTKQQIFLTDKQTAARYGLGRGTIWRWFNHGQFPKPVSLSKGCTRWRLSDLEAWENKKIEAKVA